MSPIYRLRWRAGGVLLAFALWAALAPLAYPTRERVLEIGPEGVAGGAPAEVRLTLGVRDVLLLRNRDRVPHVFGQLLVPPGGDFRLPFEQAGDFPFARDGASGPVVVVRVRTEPDPGWRRLRWRLLALAEAVHELPLRGPGD